MGRIVVVSIPYAGHVTPLLAPTRELVKRGHSVCFASLRQAAPTVAKELPGVEFIDLGVTPLGADGEMEVFRKLSDPKISGRESMQVFEQSLVRAIYNHMTAALMAHFKALCTSSPESMPEMVVMDVLSTPGFELAEYLGLPLAICNNLAGIMWALNFYGHDECNRPAHVPLEDIGLGVMPLHMNFWQRRMTNPLLKAIALKLFSSFFLPPQNERRALYGMRHVPSFRDTMAPFNPDRYAHIVGSSWLLEVERPLPPTWRMVGPMGFDFSDPASIPKLEDSKILGFVERAAAAGRRVVYMALGTLVTLDPHQVAELAAAMKLMPRVAFVWSLRGDMQAMLKPGAIDPEQVLCLDWVPQVALLFHESVAAFVSHGGMNSTNEGLAAGKPILCMPFLGDQPVNAQHITDRGVGLSLAVAQLRAERLAERLQRLLDGPSFAKAAAEMGAAMRAMHGPTDTATIVERLMAAPPRA